MSAVSIFKNFTQLVEDKSLIIITKEIKEGKYKDEILPIRQLVLEGNKQDADKLKNKLLAFTPSGTFSNGRKAETLNLYSGYVVLDIDKLSDIQLSEAKKTAALIPNTFAAFISPSGNGLKILVTVNSNSEKHKSAFKQVAQFYEDALQIKIDQSGKDICRLCYISYDEECYRNIQAIPFKVTEKIEIQTVLTENKKNEEITIEKDYETIFQECIDFTEKKSTYLNGNRNNYIHLLACNCNRSGIPENKTEEFILQQYDLNSQETKTTISSAYRNNVKDFATIAKFANIAMLQNQVAQNTETDIEDDLHDYLKSTPTIPDEVFEKLPNILKDGTSAFEDRRKHDVFFTAAIAILSGCLPKVTGIYHQERVYTHLYTFIIAPPASGKGVLKNAKRLADKYHQKVLEQSRAEQKKYDEDMIEFKNQMRTLKKGDAPPEQPIAPAFKIVFIPADTSHARMIEHLQMNDGEGIICETEADTMSGAKKQDWGDYSPALRSAFHHEKITFTRKTNNEYIEINEPRLAVALTGTPAQAPKLISSAEDGLFTRFLFYAFKNDIHWQDPSPISKTIVYNDHFEALSNQVLNLIEFLNLSPTEIHLTTQQWQILNNTFSKILNEVTTFTSENASGIVFRLGLIMYRICMIFTALRKFENSEFNNNYTCTDDDFQIALAIVKTYLSHSILMFNNLPKQGDNMTFVGGDNKRKFFEALPKEFTRKEAVSIGSSFKLSPRSVDDVLKMALGHTLIKLKTGLYQKK